MHNMILSIRVCVRVCLHRVYTRVCVRACLCVRVCLCVCLCVCTYYMYVCVYIYIYISACLDAQIQHVQYTCIQQIHVYKHLHTDTLQCTYIDIYTDWYLGKYIHTYTHAHTLLNIYVHNSIPWCTGWTACALLAFFPDRFGGSIILLSWSM